MLTCLAHRTRPSVLPSLLRGLHQAMGPRSSAKLPATFTAYPRVTLVSNARSWLSSVHRPHCRPLTGIFASSPRSSFDSRYFSSNSAHAVTPESLSDTSKSSESAGSQPSLTPKPVAYWLLFSSTLVFAVIVVGGVTRLTESGLSITEWRPITGILPPLTHSQWQEEFDKYKATPEFKL